MARYKHTKQWHETHERILEAMRNGARTIHDVYMATGISFRTITEHRKEMSIEQLTQRSA